MLTSLAQARVRLRQTTLLCAAALLSACGGSDPSVVQASAKLAAADAPASRIAQTYTLVNVPGREYMGPKAINASGQATFFNSGPDGRGRGYMYNGSSAQEIESLPGYVHMFPEAINAAGQVVGWASDENGATRAFVWTATSASAGVTTDLGSLGGGFGYGKAINGSGAVAGHARSAAAGTSRAFAWAPGDSAMRDIGTLGGSFSQAFAINAAGQIVGTASTGGSEHAFVWTPSATGGSMTGLGTLGGGWSNALDINDAGYVVGRSQASNGRYLAFRWSAADGMSNLGAPGWDYSSASFINSAGQVGGWRSRLYTDSNGGLASEWRPFFWAPAAGSDAGGMFDVGLLPGSDFGHPQGMNNGGLLVGYANTSSQWPTVRGFAWSREDGLVDLNARLAPEHAGVFIYQAYAVSDNGTILAGSSIGMVLMKPFQESASAPFIGEITATDPAAAGTTVAFSARFTDADAGDTHTASWVWEDGSRQAAAILDSAGGKTISGSRPFLQAGVHVVSLEVTDSTGRSARASRQVVVYDPTAGFVMGGGFISSPPGAFKGDPGLAGIANFGFVSRYQRGASVPTGNTEFHFQAAGMRFIASSYDWLVISGARAQFKGLGTINGMGSYRFLLTAVDGQVAGGGGTDRLRIKIWRHDAEAGVDTVIYDNLMETGLEGSASEGTSLSGGSITVHTK